MIQRQASSGVLQQYILTCRLRLVCTGFSQRARFSQTAGYRAQDAKLSAIRNIGIIAHVDAVRYPAIQSAPLYLTNSRGKLRQRSVCYTIVVSPNV